LNDNLSAVLRMLPPVHELVGTLSKDSELSGNVETTAITWAARNALTKARNIIVNGRTDKARTIGGQKTFLDDTAAEDFPLRIRKWLREEIIRDLKGLSSTLQRIINATGVVLHTNCGRALLAREVADFVAQQAVAYNNLELDIRTGNRGTRYSHVQDLLTELTGAEAALVVNNNAAAVMLIMNTLANQKEVIVSRGELVEVGGSFRIPEVLKAGGARLVEVGATNKTWLKDYREAVSPDTAMFLKVHTSNYRILGFQQAVEVEELVKLGEELAIPVVEDLGSGSFVDGVEFGLPQEPTIQEAVKSGVSLVTFSGDKLLGGPQAGIIVGKEDIINQLKRNQLTRAIRVDKLTLAALVGTLRLYQRGELAKIPVWKMLSKSPAQLRQDAEYLKELLAGVPSLLVEVLENSSCVGGGAFPTAVLPSFVCAVQPLNGSAGELEEFLRYGNTPILARIEKGKVLFDPRTLLAEDYQDIADRLKAWELR